MLVPLVFAAPSISPFLMYSFLTVDICTPPLSYFLIHLSATLLLPMFVTEFITNSTGELPSPNNSKLFRMITGNSRWSNAECLVDCNGLGK